MAGVHAGHGSSEGFEILELCFIILEVRNLKNMQTFWCYFLSEHGRANGSSPPITYCKPRVSLLCANGDEVGLSIILAVLMRSIFPV
jgi:hypothetical protein